MLQNKAFGLLSQPAMLEEVKKQNGGRPAKEAQILIEDLAEVQKTTNEYLKTLSGLQVNGQGKEKFLRSSRQ